MTIIQRYVFDGMGAGNLQLFSKYFACSMKVGSNLGGVTLTFSQKSVAMQDITAKRTLKLMMPETL